MTRSFFKVFAESNRSGVVTVPRGDWLEPTLHKYEFGGTIDSWAEDEWELTLGGFADYLADNVGFRLCSDGLRKILEHVKGPKDSFQWLPIWIRGKDERKRYWILHFPSQPDVMAHSQTEMLGGVVERNVLDAAKIAGHDVLHSPDGSIYCFLASARAREAMEEAGCTGVYYSPVEVSETRGAE